MFLFELYLKSRKAKLRSWEREGEEWVRERNSRHGFPRFSFDDYAEQNPSPVFNYKKALAYVLPAIGGLAVASLVVAGIITSPPPKVDPNNPNGCSLVVKKDDKVAVTYGPFVGSEGTVIGQSDSCAVDIKLTKSTNTRDDCVSEGFRDCRSERNVGEELNVDSSNNITKL